MQARVIRRTASVGSSILASGTSSTRTSPASYITVARIGSGYRATAAENRRAPRFVRLPSGTREQARREAESRAGRGAVAAEHPSSEWQAARRNDEEEADRDRDGPTGRRLRAGRHCR